LAWILRALNVVKRENLSQPFAQLSPSRLLVAPQAQSAAQSAVLFPMWHEVNPPTQSKCYACRCRTKTNSKDARSAQRFCVKKTAHKVAVFVCPERGKNRARKGAFPLLDTNTRYYHKS
jgi:hypothetical protein